MIYLPPPPLMNSDSGQQWLRKKNTWSNTPTPFYFR
ncbi:hypothetical protein LINPERPRIM_LOCUS32514 [Linum perenne]